MSEQALDILRNDDRLKKFKQAAAKHAHLFDIENIIPLYEKMYDKVLAAELVN
jgi:hypothetical protein